MKMESAAVDAVQSGSLAGGNARGWSLAAGLASACCVWLVAWFGSTAAAIVSIWDRSETFAHGFLVIPVVAYLIWTKRRTIAAIRPQPSWWGLLLIGGLGFGWLLAYLGQVAVAQQFTLALMIPALVITVLGRRVAQSIAFPLAFLLLGVPFGEAFIPPLMDFTADFTVMMLHLTGIPVFREGTFFQIPSGSWSVVEGCSGLRYLIASIFAGALYAYLTYDKYLKRAVFMLLSAIVPIFANGFRAYLIVMIAHLSDMRLALGVDHFIYGWVWFGIVITIMFWVGSYWRDQDVDGAQTESQASSIALKPIGFASVAVAALIAVWPSYASYLDSHLPRTSSPAIAAPGDSIGWTRVEATLTDWRPHYLGADSELFETYRKGDTTVALYLGYYRRQRQDAELINSQNVMVVQKHPVWQNIGEGVHVQRIGQADVKVRETRLRSTEQRLLVRDWFEVSGHYTVSAPLAKLLLARDRLLQRRDDGVAIIVAADNTNGDARATPALDAFIHDMLPAIEVSIAGAGGD